MGSMEIQFFFLRVEMKSMRRLRISILSLLQILLIEKLLSFIEEQLSSESSSIIPTPTQKKSQDKRDQKHKRRVGVGFVLIGIILCNKSKSNNQMDENPFLPRAVTCLLHRKQKATHICTDLACQQNTFLCNLCFNDSRWRSQHPHEAAVKPLNEGVEWLTTAIRTQTKSVELLYERTIGSREAELIKFNLEKGVLLSEQLDNRLDNLRMQLQLQMELLMKQFQKQIQAEKLEFTRRLEEYKRTFLNNLDILRRECGELLNYQNSLKFYNNCNNFTMKLINQTERRSQEWIQAQKRVLLRVSQTLQSPNFANSLNLLLGRVNKANLLMMPSWKGEKRDGEIEKEIHNCIKNALNSWIELPQMMDLDQLKPNQYSNSNKFIPYSTSL